MNQDDQSDYSRLLEMRAEEQAMLEEEHRRYLEEHPEKPESRKHPECEDRCHLLEYKGYHSCSQTGRCELFEQDKVNAYADYSYRNPRLSDDGISAWIHGAGERPSSYFTKDKEK